MRNIERLNRQFLHLQSQMFQRHGSNLNEVTYLLVCNLVSFRRSNYNMPHNKHNKKSSNSHSSMSLMSILMNAIADFIANRQVNKIISKVKKNPNVTQSIKNFDSAYKKLGNDLKSYCEKYPEYCKDLIDDPELKSKFLDN